MEDKTYQYYKDANDFRLTEAYKTLRTNITFCGDDVKVIAVTSCIPNEGKSTVSWNIACAMAETGKKTLYVDADLRKSVMVGRLKLDTNVLGLSHLLSGQAELGEVIYETQLKNLHGIFAGSFPPNPAELLGNKRFKALVDVMRARFDYIIIDTPPLGSVIDSAIISTVCDGTVMVMASGSVSYKFAREVKGQLEKSGCKILGAILNKVNFKDNGPYYSKYYGYTNDYSHNS